MTQRSTRAAAALIIDQGLYSGSNFVFVLAQSRHATPAEFANLAASLALLTLLVAMGRYVFHEPAMAGMVSGAYRPRRVPIRSLHVYWLIATVAMLTVSTTLLGSGATGIALITPLVLVQDQRRYAWFSLGSADAAVAADAVWTIAVLPMFFVGASVDARSLWWGLAAGISCAVDLVRRRRPDSTAAFPSRVVGQRRYVVIDFLVNELSVPIGLLLLARSHRPEAAATFRIVLIPFGILWVAVGALRSLGIAEHRRLAPEARARRARVISALSAGLAVGLWLVLATGGAERWKSLIGSSWPTTGAVVALAGGLHVAKAAQTGALLDLKAAARFREVCAVRLCCGLMPMLVGWWGAAAGSAPALMGALGVGEALTFVALVVVTSGHAPTVFAAPRSRLASDAA